MSSGTINDGTIGKDYTHLYRSMSHKTYRANLKSYHQCVMSIFDLKSVHIAKYMNVEIIHMYCGEHFYFIDLILVV